MSAKVNNYSVGVSIFGVQGNILASLIYCNYNFMHLSYVRAQWVVLSFFLCLFSAVLSAQVYVDVDATSGGDGTSWQNAFTDLQSALDNTGPIEIWVAEGTYKPSAYPADCMGCATDRDFTFQLKDGVSLYGGFVGTEALLSERDIAMNPTILSGDLGTGGGAYHVVLAAFASTTPTTRLDGFTISGGGNTDGNSSVTVNGVSVERLYGGGIHTVGGTTTLTNNNLSGNAANRGGGIFTIGGTHTLTNNSLSGNTARSGAGGGIFISDGPHTLTNNSLSGNTAGFGGGIYTEGGTNTLTNNIIWGNSSGIESNGGDLTVTHSIVQQASGVYSGTGNLNEDPLFVDQPAEGLGTSGDLRLMDTSPAIDAGTNSGAPATDLDGQPRPLGAGYDMGAFEFDACPSGNILYVNYDASGNNDGTSWADAFTDLQSAIANTCPGITEIWVAADIYKPSAYPADCMGCATERDFTFLLKGEVSLYGGFAGTEILLSERDIAANPTILSGDIGTVGNASDNVHHVVLAAFSTTTPTTRLDGFIITMGIANGSSNITVNGATIARNRGGGILTLDGTNTLTNNGLLENLAIFGGGIYTSEGTNTLRNNIIWGNGSSGITSNGGTLTVTHSIVQGGFTGEGNLDVDPLFVDQPPEGLGTSGNLRLMASSPAIDAGTNSGAPATDSEGKPRPIGAGYDMGAFESDAPLPVEFLVFKGEYRGKANELEWTTLSELNNDYFAVQHSMDGVNFEAIGTENGRGASNTLTDYRFSHQNPSQGVHYYRLKQFDFDARFDYSEVISINVQGEEELALYPNPAQDQLTIVNGQGVAFISNVLGQSVQQFSISESQQTIQIDDLQDGHYFVQIIRGNGEVVVKKFVKR
jgi:parallel beta-helix repeat protein